MSKHSLLIIGCGDLGQRVGEVLSREGWHISAVRRHPPEADATFDWTAADYSLSGSLDFAEQLRPDFVIASFTPTSMDLEGYQRGFTDGVANVLKGLGSHRPRLVVMVSSTRVYAETDGGWVDEDSAMSVDDERAVAIIEAERLLLSSQQHATIVRFGGIYGDPGGRLLAKIRRGHIAPEHPLRYTNRIHRDDCAGFLIHLLKISLAGQPLEPAYNGVDNDPATAHEVESWIANTLGCKAAPSDVTAANRPANHKRCRNDRLRASGYQLRYPDYRAGYTKVCSDAVQ